MSFYYSILFILWICFWSFSTVLISRWKTGKWWIIWGRSECPHCNHTLTTLELIPIFSWVFQWWKCKECKTSIPKFYPLTELFMWALFMWAWYISISFWYLWYDVMWWLLLFWTFVTGVYIIYDIRYMEIPDQIIIPWILVSILLLCFWFLGENYIISFDYNTYPTFHTFIYDHILAGICAYTFFFLQIFIPGSIFLYKNKRKSEILLLCRDYIVFPIFILWDFCIKFFKHPPIGKDMEAPEEIPGWIGGWDLRIALFIGLTLWFIHTWAAILIAYIIWWSIGIILIIYGKIRNKEIQKEIAFWPFLGIGWILALTFYNQILQFIQI